MSTDELRELDCWIAEHVIGWQWWRFNIGGDGKKSLGKWCQLVSPEEKWPYVKTAWHGILCKTKIANMKDYTDLSMFRPSTDPAAAMLVLEKCLAGIGSTSLHMNNLGGRFIIYWGTDRNFSERVEASTLPLAICLFAKQIFCK